MTQNINNPKSNPLQIYIGCLPKEAREGAVCEYLSRFDPAISATLVFKKNQRDCRGYGTLTCSSQDAVERILQAQHRLFDRRIIIERVKTQEEVSLKYRDLTERKLRIMFPTALHPDFGWTNASFIAHFEAFGEIENAKLYPIPEKIHGEYYYVGNLTFLDSKNARLLKSSEDSAKHCYLIKETISPKQQHKQISHLLQKKGTSCQKTDSNFSPYSAARPSQGRKRLPKDFHISAIHTPNLSPLESILSPRLPLNQGGHLR